MNQVKRYAGLEQKAIPPDLDYEAITGLGSEVKQKLKQVRPVSLARRRVFPGLRRRPFHCLWSPLRSESGERQQDDAPEDPH